MNNTRQERLVSLVRKLLDLSRCNSNPHEAGLALSRAQRLMKQYGITKLLCWAVYVVLEEEDLL